MYTNIIISHTLLCCIHVVVVITAHLMSLMMYMYFKLPINFTLTITTTIHTTILGPHGIIMYDIKSSLTLAAKRRRRVTAIVWRFLSVRPSVRPSVW